jgi:hypothetical protein
MVLRRRSLLCALALLAAVISPPTLAQTTAPSGAPCDPWAARLISFQGTLSVRSGGFTRVSQASLNDTFCVGDVLEVGAYSRAALQLPDQTVVRVDQGTVITFAAPKDDKRTWLDILKGAVHIISRDPRALRVITPFANAGIEGTEFFVGVNADAATVIVYEGRVKVENAVGSATAGSGESVLAQAGRAPVLQQVVRPRDAVQWTLYFPPTSSGPLPAADAEPPAGGADAAFYIGRAESRLSVGQVAGAQADLDAALKLAPGSGEALARQSVIALTQNDTAKAVELADQAVAAAPASAAARLARSYARQAQFNIPGAIEDLQAAAAAHPDNALVQARLAEMWLATGDVRRSERAARAAVAADPQLVLAHTVLGFNQLTRIDLEAAETTFLEAIRLQSASPLPWLGLGLTRIRRGHLAAGREDIESAVILDPSGSLLRSYMGKAYFEEKRDRLSAAQYQLAKELDPQDPTPWFYDALRLQTVNQPERALQNLRKSIELNDNRGVYRSRFLLADDAAVRNAGVSAIYDELGFPVLAVVEGTDGLAESYGNSSAHRLLANAYADLPRYDISRVSEALQAQIRQPLSVPPIDLQESSDNQIIARGIATARVGVNEYNSLFNRNELRLEVDGLVGSLDTAGNQVVFSGLQGRTGFALSQFHYDSDGYGENTDAEKNIYDGFVQYEVSPTTSLQLDARYSDYSTGYTFLAFDPEYALFPLTLAEDADTYRFNGRHESSPGNDLIWTLGYQDLQFDASDYNTGDLQLRSIRETYVAELQSLNRMGDLQLVSGLGYIDATNRAPLFTTETADTDDANGYIYAQWRPNSGNLTLIGGFGLDVFDSDPGGELPYLERQHLSPKVGLVWNPVASTTVRAAAFQSLRRPLMADQTIEPTQVASFNQFFTGLEQFYGDPEGTVSTRVGLSVDQVLTDSVFAGVQGAVRHLEVPYLYFQFDELGDFSYQWVDRSWREKSASAYLYKTIAGTDGGPLQGWSASLSLSADYEAQSRPQGYSGPEGILDLDTTTIPLGLAIFSPGGLGLRLVPSYVHQDGRFSVDLGQPVFDTSEDGWIADVLVQFRLPKRYGILSAGARNVFDNELNLTEADPLNPRIATRRLVFANINFIF